MRQLAALLAAIWLSSCVVRPGQFFPTPAPSSPTPAPTDTAVPTPLATAPAPPTLPPALATTPTAPDLDAQAQALLPEFRGDAASLTDSASYRIEAQVEFDGRSNRAAIEGTARIRYPHQGQEPLDEVTLMLWPNDEQYRSQMSVGPALINGRLVAGEDRLAGLAVRYPMVESLAPGDTLDLTVPFSLTAGGPIGQGRPARFGISEGVFFAPTFYPLLPPYQRGEWQAKDAPYGGDTAVSETALYSVRLEVPSDLQLVATGVETAREDLGPGRAAVEYVTGPVRDFAFALGELTLATTLAGPVEVHLWHLPQHESDVRLVLNAAAFQLELLSERIGPYPYTELDIVDLPGAFGGIEYPALVTIGTLGGPWITEPVVHEVAHQWFYGLIGDDQVEEPWLDEAFATYATALYLENARGSGWATGYLSDHWAEVRNHPEAERPIGEPVDAYPGGDYRVLVYLKGALFYQQLRQELGDEAFFDFLQAYFDRYRYGVATSQDFQSVAEQTCGCQLDDLFDRWVYRGGPLPVP